MRIESRLRLSLEKRIANHGISAIVPALMEFVVGASLMGCVVTQRWQRFSLCMSKPRTGEGIISMAILEMPCVFERLVHSVFYLAVISGLIRILHSADRCANCR
jgi:hypothetical protein